MVKPMSARLRLEKEQVWKVAVGVWIIAILTNIPIFRDIYFDAKSKHCFVAWHFTTGEGMATYVGCYMAILNCVSGILIAFCYVSILKGLYITNTICSEMVPTNDGRDSKKKLAKLVATVTASFYILLIPYAIFTIYMAAAEKPRGNTAYSNDALFVSFYVTSSLCMVNSCINPILYALQSSSYRRGFAKLYPCCMKHQEEEMAAPARHANPSCNSTTQAHA
ncbi:predicted protein [Nematostella vectensis]|uniref:G-protein coupled receptors family 1 profile domain-containing protein n=1 Tax=Nematostella vectensis TaxID=45351 RepID=A8DVP9_NEMVE|nr:predicted protein [Nematostella vectensis]|eukprot:XP_001617810.1 hypothetical protein NEMVEDRAFT_v1g225772 [Nematostella vectensis]